jgi:hypothetical protein
MNRLRVAVIAVTAAGAGALVARATFFDQLDALDQQLADAQDALPVARTDLSPEVAALAARLGARADHPSRHVDFGQTGTMWMKPGGAPQRFTARQRIGTSKSGFVWRAQIGRFGQMMVVDSFVAGQGMLEARLFGIARVARLAGTASINEGELLRYLAELPLNPDGILFDHALEWTVADTHTIRVAIGTGNERAEISFGLDEDGLIATASAASRAYDSSGKRYPWNGRFWDYQRVCGRLLPIEAEVAWDIDGAAFSYWRGKMCNWRASVAE